MTNIKQLRVTFDKVDAKKALEELIPSMESGFIVNTAHGDMSLHGDDAVAVMELVKSRCEAKLVEKAPSAMSAENRVLDYCASLCCGANTGRKWVELDDEEKSFWRNEAKTQAQEWSNEVLYCESRRSKKGETTDHSVEP
jgi:hypothetical protein